MFVTKIKKISYLNIMKKACIAKTLFWKFLKNATRVSAEVCFKRELKRRFSMILQTYLYHQL